MPELLTPDWPSPPGVVAAFSTRVGGVSDPPWDSLNLALHVDDDPARVAENRRRLGAALGWPSEPVWLRQVHGVDVVELGAGSAGPVEADGVWTREAGVVCAVQVADCAPVLLSAIDGSAVAAVHAGWRGAADGVLGNAVARLADAGIRPARLQAWVGPCISAAHFEVGDEVREQFMARDPGSAACFVPHQGRWLADLPRLVTRALAAAGVGLVRRSSRCTFTEPGAFFSYRRDGRCGRMAALIWRA